MSKNFIAALLLLLTQPVIAAPPVNIQLDKFLQQNRATYLEELGKLRFLDNPPEHLEPTLQEIPLLRWVFTQSLDYSAKQQNLDAWNVRLIYHFFRELYSSWDTVILNDSECQALLEQLPPHLKSRRKQLLLAASYILQWEARQVAHAEGKRQLREAMKEERNSEDSENKMDYQRQLLRLDDLQEFDRWGFSSDVAGPYLIKAAPPISEIWNSQKDKVWKAYRRRTRARIQRSFELRSAAAPGNIHFRTENSPFRCFILMRTDLIGDG